MKWEYKVEKFPMPSDWKSAKETWDDIRLNHYSAMNELGLLSWEYMTNIGPLFYFKRPIEEATKKIPPDTGYTYETVQDGYVIFGPDGRKMPGWDVVSLLNQYAESRKL